MRVGMLSAVHARRVTVAALRPQVDGGDSGRADDRVNSFDRVIQGTYNQPNA